MTAKPTTPRHRSTPTRPSERSIESYTYSYDQANSSPLREDFKEHKKLTSKQPQPLVQFSLGQVVALMALGASFAAIVTVLVSVHVFSTSVNARMDIYPLILPETAMRNLRQEEIPRPVVVEPKEVNLRPVPVERHEDNPNPKIVWLMSFPNSGTSFTIHMTREATNCTTATNYGLEGEIRDKPSVPAIQGPAGVNGPWLELLPHRATRVADTILTKTHCKGFCSGSFCGAEKTFHTTRSFMMGCLTGNQGIESSKGLRLTDKTYDKSLVKKAIHIFRHPLDNVVARFHLEYNEKRMAGDTRYTTIFPKDIQGFRRWCALDDRNRGLVQSRFVDNRLRGLMLQIPCFNEFYRYGQWHNLAFETTRAMNLTTMLLHYHEFADDFVKARSRILSFLELPLIGEGIEFDDGKVYGRYYSRQEKVAISNFLQEFSSAETWEQLKHYDFETDESPATAFK